MHKGIPITALGEMVEFLLDRTRFSGRVAVILGSGLGQFGDLLEKTVTVPYTEIPFYPKTKVKGHVGEFVFGTLKGVELLAAKGRFHFYEGHDFQTITLPIRLFQKLGVSHVIITNAAGSMNLELAPGSLMLMKGHMDCTFRHSVDDPAIYSGPPYYDTELLALARQIGTELKIPLAEGVYCWSQGPAYETPAEITYFQSLKGDAVGMSTVPEIIMAGELGLSVLGISCITNYAAGITSQPLNHQEVLDTANRVSHNFTRLLTQIIKRMKDKV
jgi:purine-nucleoside phosphorylase